MQHLTDADLEYWRGRSTVVTGGTGFIGSCLVHRLVDLGAKVTVIDAELPESGSNPFNLHGVAGKVTVCRSDVADAADHPEWFENVEVIFHLAGQTSHGGSMREPHADLHANVSGTLALLEGVRHRNPAIRIVFTSTRQVYGKVAALPVPESQPVNPPDINAIHKLAAEAYLSLYWRLFGIASTTLRLTNTYGPRMRIRDARQMFLGVWIRNALQSRPLDIFGDGTQRRDFNHVADVVSALLLAVRPGTAGKCYNLGGPAPLTLTELAQQVISAAGNGEFRYVPFPPERKEIDIGDYWGDHTQFTQATGWVPRVPLNEGLADTLAFFRAHLQHYIS